MRVGAAPPRRSRCDVGSIVVATGFDSYQPEAGEFGYGLDGVVTLPEFKELLDRAERAAASTTGGRSATSSTSTASAAGRPPSGAGANQYCSRFCCTAAVHASVQAAPAGRRRSTSTTSTATCAPTASTSCCTTSRAKQGSVFLRFPDDAPPAVALGADGRLVVTVRDLLTGGEELAIPADLVVLVTGMVPRAERGRWSGVLKLPLGADGFFNEIHPKLRPVETVVDGVLIAGACQGPKTSTESVASGLAAVTQSAAILTQGLRRARSARGDRRTPSACTWCGEVRSTRAPTARSRW